VSNRSTVRTVAILAMASLALASCGTFKKGKTSRTPTIGERIPILSFETRVEASTTINKAIKQTISTAHMSTIETTVASTYETAINTTFEATFTATNSTADSCIFHINVF